MKRVLKWIVRSIKGMLILFGLTTLLSALFLGYQLRGLKDKDAPEAMPDGAILMMDFAKPIRQKRRDHDLQEFLDSYLIDTHTLHTRLRAGAHDDRVQGLVVDFRGANLDIADFEDWNITLQTYQEAGKRTAAYLKTLPSGGRSILGYSVLSQIDHLVMHEHSTFSLTGLAVESPFIKTALKDHLNIYADIVRMTDEKTGANTVIEDAFTPPHRAMVTDYLGALDLLARQRITDARGLSSNTIDTALAAPMMGAEEALNLGLIDDVMPYESFLDQANTLVSVSEFAENNHPAGEYFPVRSYQPTRSSSDIKPTLNAPTEEGSTVDQGEPLPTSDVALIYMHGPIMDGYRQPEEEIFDSGDQVHALSVADDIHRAIKDDVAAIILSIDSPGGSYMAAHTIRDALIQAKNAGIPIVAQFGNMAASGGYFVAMDADHIVATPSTLVGSIGVFSGKMVLADLSEAWDVRWDRVITHPHALFWSTQSPFTDDQRSILQSSVQRSYDVFADLVVEGRGLTKNQAQRAIGGRFFTGTDAETLGLIDQFGDLESAITAAVSLADISREHAVIRVYPKVDNVFGALIGLVAKNVAGQALQADPLRGAWWTHSHDIIRDWYTLGQTDGPLAVIPPMKLGDQWMW